MNNLPLMDAMSALENLDPKLANEINAKLIEAAKDCARGLAKNLDIKCVESSDPQSEHAVEINQEGVFLPSLVPMKNGDAVPEPIDAFIDPTEWEPINKS